MKNKKGFTLIQLIICLVILGLFMVFVVPIINEAILNNKKDKMIEDAKAIIAKAEERISRGKLASPNSENTIFIKLSDVDFINEINESPFGKPYDLDYQLSEPYVSYIFVKLDSDNERQYGICLTDNKYTLEVLLAKEEDFSILDTDYKYQKVNEHQVGDCYILQ